MGDVVFLPATQVRQLRPLGENLFYQESTGDYLRYIGTAAGNLDVGQYEVVSSPCWGDSSIVTDYKDSYEQLRKMLSEMWLSPRRKESIWEVKEKEMEIGGNQCHLCGEGLLYSDINRTFVKKHRKVESHKVYMCGTTIYDTWNEHDVQPHETKKKRHIHAECLIHCCEG